MRRIGILVMLLTVFVMAEDYYGSIMQTRSQIIKGLLENKTDSTLILMQKGLMESESYGEHSFTPYEVITINTLSGNYNFSLNTDSLNYYISDSYTRYVSVPRDGLSLNIQRIMKEYLRSDKHKARLDLLSENDRVFLNGFFIIMGDSISQDEMNEYVEKNIKFVSNPKQRSYLIKKLWYKDESSWWRLYVDIGGGGNFFINGADKVLKNTGHMDMGFRFCYYSFCPEYELQIINSRSRADIEQDGYVFPKESGPQLLVSKMNVGYKTYEAKNFENYVYGGLALTSFGIAEKQVEEYEIEESLRGLSIGYNIGTSIDIYLNPIRTGVNEYSSLGFRGRIGYIQLVEKEINELNGGSFYWSIQSTFKIFSKKESKYE